MSFKLIAGILLAITICHFSCAPRPPKKYHQQLVLKDSFEHLNLPTLKTEFYSGIQHITIDSSVYFVSFADRQLLFSCVFDSAKSFSIDLKTNLFGLSDFLVGKLKHDRFYVFDGDKKILMTYKLDYFKAKAFPEHSYEIPASLGLDLAKGRRYVRYTVGSTFEISDSLLFLCYGKNFSEQTYWLYNKAYIGINMRDSSPNEFIPDMPVPKRYIEGKSYDANNYISAINDSLLLYGSEAYDSLYIYDLKTRLTIRRTKFSDWSDYRDFPMQRVKDIGFDQKFEMTNERNMNFIINDKADKILVIKRLKKENKKDSSIYEYYLLNKNLQLKAFNKFSMEISPERCMAYLNGFLIIDFKRKKGYYYE